MAIRFLSAETIDGNITVTGDITISTSRPAINLTNTGSNPDWRIENYAGQLAFVDTTSSFNQFIMMVDAGQRINKFEGWLRVNNSTNPTVALDVTGSAIISGNITLGATKTLKYADDKIKIGGTSNTPGAQGIQIGSAADSSGAQGIGMGYAANATGNQSIAMGYNPTASGTYSQAFGYNVTASGSGTVVFGTSGSHSDADTFVLSGIVLKVTGTGASTFSGNVTLDPVANSDVTLKLHSNSGALSDAYAWNLIAESSGDNYEFSIAQGTTDVLKFNNTAAAGNNNATFAGTVTATQFIGVIAGTTASFVSTVAGATVVSSEGAYSGSGSVKLYEAKRSGGAVGGDWSYDDATTDMSLGTNTNHAFALKTNNIRALTISNSQNVGIGVAPDTSVRTFIKGSDSGTNNFQILTRNSSDDNILAVRNDGNVGIGTTVPAFELQVGGTDVSGTGSFSAQFAVLSEATTGYPSGFIFKAPRVTTSSNRVLVNEDFGTYFSSQVYATSTAGAQSDIPIVFAPLGGNVGIGTTSPHAPLTIYNATSSLAIQNSATGTGGSQGLYLGVSTGTIGYLWNYENDDLVFGANNLERMKVTGAGAIEIKGTSTTTYAQAFLTNDNTSLTIGSSVSASVDKPLNFQVGGTNRLIIDSTGNVGIGVSTINNPFTAQAALQVGDTSTTTNNGLITIGSGTAGSGDIYFADGTSGGSAYRGFVSYKHNGDYLAFGTAETTRMIIDTSGNVGIGVTPSNAFVDSRAIEIGANGTIWSEQASGVYNSIMSGVGFYYNAAGATIYKTTSLQISRHVQYQGEHIFQYAAAGTAGGAITWSEAFRTSDTGNVGIGTTGPTAKLQIGSNVDPSQTAESLVHLLSSTTSSTVNGFTHLKLDYTSGASPGTAGAQIMFNQGYHPGNTDYTQPVGSIRGWKTGADYNYGGGLQLLYQPDAGALGVLVGMTLTGGGNVGIGTTTPDEKLEVKGNIVLNGQSTATGTTELDSLIFRKLHPAGAGSGYYNQGLIKGVTYGGYAGGMNFYYNRSNNDGSGSYTNTQALWLNEYGNFCIGENSSSYKLRVKGGTVALNSVSNGAYITAGTSSSNHALYVEGQGSGGEWLAVRGDGEIRLNASNGHTYAAQGIRLGSNVASSNLDYYQQGSWTPAVTTSQLTNPTITSSSGRYQRVGKVVTASFEFTMSNPAVGAGAVIINNLPIAIADTDHVSGCGVVTSLGKTINVWHYTATNQIAMYYYDGNYCGTTYRTVGTVTYWAAT